MLEIDGGDGGGQILRTALALSMVTDTPVEVTDIRGSRSTPGLRPQHLAGVRVAEAVSDADVSAVEVGATDLTFVPDEPSGGDYHADIGTAGSVTLLFETVLPLATTLDEPLTLAATGGTDVKWSPTAAYYERVKLPLLARFGLDAAVTLHHSGFYPAGGGEATLRLAPSSLSALDLTARGPLERVVVHSKASTSLENKSVAVRQAAAAEKRLSSLGVDYAVEQPVYVPATSPGSALLLEARYAESVVGFDALGERGKSSEQVADEAVDAFEAFTATDAAVDEQLADQVMLPLALAGGEVRIPRVTAHVRTNLAAVQAFGLDLSLSEASDGTALLTAPGYDS
ncbi:RNA 3'-terminal phosphate cyclase (ATP) [Halogranum gelatinilyticum]|uniref:RNA 3'-terminal phosphate cyclase n=1 Tax=Halogranum gelatinilyticum TaxID=660521 RepID=A0A1G9UM03_9EURY|nr:RNA 3'-terminal phosphate cyclase [Halogranum gelatinilyticum]SDM60864.1 RNA 3'-terminal phosphate cyclase (ATP) [Halogranum gelatinilyticum]